MLLSVAHPEGVALNSPGSRSAPWGHERGGWVYPGGVAQTLSRVVVQPLRGRKTKATCPSFPGCAARPWAAECDPFGVSAGSLLGFRQSNAPLQRFKVLNDRPALLLRQLVAEGVPAVAAAGLRGVVHLAALERRHVGAGPALHHLHFPAELFGVVGIQVCFIGAREHLGPGLGIENVIH